MNQRFGVEYTADQILESINAGIYVADLERRIVYWNRSAEEITGWRAAEVVGSACRDNILCHTDKNGNSLCGKEHCPLQRAMVTGASSAAPSLVFAKSRAGRLIPVMVSVAPIFDAQGQVIGGVEVFHDHSAQMRELERARRIEAFSLRMPARKDPRLRLAAYYAPRDIVGGDYYTVGSIDEDRYGFLIADVMGHGIAAALHAIYLHSLWEANRQLLDRPPLFVGALNRSLCELVGDGESFATALFGLIDLRRETITLCSAGGPPFLQAEQSGVQVVSAAGLPLGMTPAASYEERVLELNPGDGLLLVTDGALEIQSPAQGMLGGRGLAALVQESGFPDSEAALRRLAERLLAFSSAIHLEDDVTMLAIRYLGQGR